MVKYTMATGNGLSGTMLHLWGNPFQFRQSVDHELMSTGGGSDPGKGGRNPKEFWVLIGTIAGIIICCTIGAIIGTVMGGLGGTFLGVVAGLFIGGFGGSWLGERFKNRVPKTRRKEGSGDGNGPFIN